MTRITALLLLSAVMVSADVVVLKDGAMVGGKVVEKEQHYEVTTPAGLRTFLKEEVEKVLTSPEEVLKDGPKLFGEAKQEYQEAMALASPVEQAEKCRGAIAKLKGARELYANARELFPEDKHADLDKQLMNIMQLMRLLRDRVGSDIARKPAEPEKAAEPEKPKTVPLIDAVGVVRDAARRADQAQREEARRALEAERSLHPEMRDLLWAALVFLSKTDQEWKLVGPSMAALQDYLSKPWLLDPAKLTSAGHRDAAWHLIEKILNLQQAQPPGATEALSLFAMGHLGHARSDPELDKAAARLGLVSVNGLFGTREGHAVRDLNGWIAGGEFDLAVLAFVNEHRGTDTTAVRFVWSWAMLQMVQKRRRGFDRPVAALQGIRGGDSPFRDHAAALVKSIKAVGSCGTCAGEGRLRCTNCHGKKQIRFICRECGGTGKRKQKNGFEQENCPPCKNSGTARIVRCEKCRDGYNDCPQCPGPRTAPALEDICTSKPCDSCEGRGVLFTRVLIACRSCVGLGVRLTPKADPSKVLP